MNRNQRRARQHAQDRRNNGPVVTGHLLIGLPETLARIRPRCPDCASDIERWTDRDGIEHIDLMHDDTCPTWQAMQRQARQ
jgi:hypothetical protein